ncbi:hypothetical protein ACRQ5Q_42825 (plasmid) [Bradyrhizobium sp. PMVTL-01]|uniref:hypothetical protein n=1 Tax=Bradyrhizobium sp. PMVTL-01 TaxID=3434999 RepID=UPI003F707ACD
MLMTKERPAIRTLRGWAISVLQEAGAIRECEEQGWMQDRADPHARERAFELATHEPPPGASPDGAVTELREFLESIGDTSPRVLTKDGVYALEEARTGVLGFVNMSQSHAICLRAKGRQLSVGPQLI